MPRAPRVRVIGPGRAGGSFARALAAAGWSVSEPIGRSSPVTDAGRDVDLVLVATPDAEIASVASRITPDPSTVVAHLSGALGPGPLLGHPRWAVIHPLVALPDPERGARRLRGAWFGLSVAGDPLARDVVSALEGRSVTIADDGWARYHAAAAIAANHLVAVLGQAERVAATVGLPLEALLDLAAGSLDDVRELGPVAALTGPVRRGDVDTVRRHLAALPEAERAAYLAMARQAAMLVPGGVELPDA